MFNFAEGNFPSLFSGTPTSGQAQQYDYRYYPGSGNYLAVDNTSSIFVMGPATGGALKLVGLVSSFYNNVTAWETSQAAAQATAAQAAVAKAAAGVAAAAAAQGAFGITITVAALPAGSCSYFSSYYSENVARTMAQTALDNQAYSQCFDSGGYMRISQVDGGIVSCTTCSSGMFTCMTAKAKYLCK
jgi:hypothetical protein